jgi:DNA-binding HxlR family transcriptional regulator
VAGHDPLSTPLSQLLVAFTIEVDNEFEHRMPHRTTLARQAGETQPRGPWLTSLVMWADFLRLIPEGGRPFAAVEDAAALVNLAGLQRWRYIDLSPATPAAGEAQRVELTRAGRAANARWAPLPAEIEDRWRQRWGDAALRELREPLEAVADSIDVELPRYLPVGGAHRADRDWPPRTSREPAAGLDLSVLLSRVLIAWSSDFHRESKLPIRRGANVLRVLDDRGVRVRDLPARTGIAKETVAVSLGALERSGLAVVEADLAAPRTKQARLTAKGKAAQRQYHRVQADVEAAWSRRWGAGLHDAVAGFTAATAPDGRPLLAVGLQPYPEGWRATKAYAAQTAAMQRDPLGALPHFPMVTHRGGYPDGS